MSETKHFQFSPRVILVPLLLVLIIWTVFLVEVRLGINFNTYGVYPRTLSGLKGILCSPFIHGSIEHLYNNTIPLAILSASVLYFYRKASFKILFYGVLLSGVITWCIGRSSYHIGASGLIYVLVSFIFFKGIFTKYYRLVALSLIVVFIYGSMLWYIFPVDDAISWEGHLGGFLTGLFFAFVLDVPIPERKKFDWEREDFKEEDDEFLQHFDEYGNFIEKKPEEQSTDITEGFKITYHFKPNKEGPP